MRVTKHARRRSKQRNGFTKGTVEKMSSRAWADGLPRDVIVGELREVLDRFHGKFVRYYVNYPSPKGNGLLLNGSPD